MEDTKKKTEGEKTIIEAIAILKSGKKRNFVESVDIDIRIHLKDKQKKESLKGSVSLPNTFGSEKRVIVFCEDKDVSAAKKAGAIEAGLVNLEKKVADGWNEFDVVIATPSVMPKIARLGKALGPKGLMPNPKNGTISDDIESAVKSFKEGKMNFQMEQGHGLIKASIGKVDMEDEKLLENVIIFLKAVVIEAKKLNPNPLKRVILKKTMGSGIKLDLNDIIASI